MLEAPAECRYALAMLPADAQIKLIECANRVASAQWIADSRWNWFVRFRLAKEAEQAEENLCVKGFVVLKNETGRTFPLIFGHKSRN